MNDEVLTNGNTRVVCQGVTECCDCTRGQCQHNHFRTKCTEEENSRRYQWQRRQTDSHCAICPQPECKVTKWQQNCDGSCDAQNPHWGNTVSSCQPCTTADCELGKRRTKCNGLLEVDTTCVPCTLESCNHRVGLDPYDFGYYQGMCLDAKTGDDQKHPCLQCTQSCDAGNWNGGCLLSDFRMIPACVKCRGADDARGDDCPHNEYLVKCTNGFGVTQDGTKRIGRNSCNTCPAEMQPKLGALAKEDCECKPGSEQINENLDDGCQKCQTGKYMVTVTDTMTSCVACFSGTAGGFPYAMTTMQEGTNCVCPIKFYKETASATKCLRCHATRTSKVSVFAGIDECVCDRANGYFVDPNGGPCMLCPPGKHTKYDANEGDFICESCPAGTSRNEGEDVTKCNTCTIGKISIAGRAQCTPCGAGQVAKNSVCVDCVAGKYSNGTVAMTECEAGRYAQNTTSEVCDSCERGQVSEDRSACELLLPPIIMTAPHNYEWRKQGCLHAL